MKCQQCADLLSEYIDGRLADAESLQVTEHLRSCSACRRLEKELRATVALVGSLDRQAVPVDMAETVAARLERRMLLAEPQPPKRRLIMAPWRLAGVGAAVAAVLLVALYVWGPRVSTVPRTAARPTTGDEGALGAAQIQKNGEAAVDRNGAWQAAPAQPSMKPETREEQAVAKALDGQPPQASVSKPAAAPIPVGTAGGDGKGTGGEDVERKETAQEGPTSAYGMALNRAREIASTPPAGTVEEPRSSTGEEGVGRTSARAFKDGDVNAQATVPAETLAVPGRIGKRTAGGKLEAAEETVTAEVPADARAFAHKVTEAEKAAPAAEAAFNFDGKIADAADEFLKLVPVAVQGGLSRDLGVDASKPASSGAGLLMDTAKPGRVPLEAVKSGASEAAAAAGPLEAIKSAADAHKVSVVELGADKAVFEYAAERAEIVRIVAQLRKVGSLTFISDAGKWPMAEDLGEKQHMLAYQQQDKLSAESARSETRIARGVDRSPAPVTVRFVFTRRPAPAEGQPPAQTR